MEEVSRNEALVLEFLADLKNARAIPEREISIEGLDERSVSSSVSWLESKGLIDCKRETVTRFVLTDEAISYIAHGFPEEILLNLVLKGKNSVKEILKEMGSQNGKIALAQLAKFDIKPVSGIITLKGTDKILETTKKRRNALLSIQAANLPEKDILNHLKSRGSLLEEKRSQIRFVQINEKGRRVSNSYRSHETIDALTTEMLTSGGWKGKEFRKYDLNSKVSRLESPFLHPLTVLINRIREIFFDLGFSEMTGHYLEHASWNMDALFIPQDHSVRDMQDTFYVESEVEQEMEHPEIIDTIKKVHENGFGKYSGWNYKWNRKEGDRLLLRTHTTVSSARYLYEHNEPPVAVFSVEKVFRHESVDWKHLAEFYQIEGVVYSKDANLSTLKWLLSEFYRKLGFSDFRLIPSYYPYTEPSMDVAVRVGNRELELGGSGVFRPEVEKILGLKCHAIAWGLGLERLALLYYNFEDIRSIYNSDIEWLRSYKISP